MELHQKTKKQAGEFTEFNFNYGLEMDKRDRTFMPTSGSIMSFTQSLPIYADQPSLLIDLHTQNTMDLVMMLLVAIKFYAATVTALDEDVRLSKRLNLPW